MVCILLGDGFEEAEALVPADMLRRAGADVKLVSVTHDLIVTGSHGICVAADLWIGSAAAKGLPEALILPGGMGGVESIKNSKRANEFITKCFEENVLIGAICAAPTLLSSMGLIKDKRATCYPDMKDLMDCAEWVDEDAVRDGDLITSKAAGTAYQFAFALIEALCGEQAAKKVKASVFYAK
ncbi:MAG: DJ-1/PfpI family protein [Clostridia bacterium]|nr:DJ-1/PfpI family protein [Clostridia bacterium]